MATSDGSFTYNLLRIYGSFKWKNDMALWKDPGLCDCANGVYCHISMKENM